MKASIEWLKEYSDIEIYITGPEEAINTELNTREKPYKTYLKEKMDSINWDIKVLNNMINKGDD